MAYFRCGGGSGGALIANGYLPSATRTPNVCECGFKPKYICIWGVNTSAGIVYDSKYDATKQRTVNQSGTLALLDCPSNTTTGCRIIALDDTSFTFRGYDTARAYQWFAIG